VTEDGRSVTKHPRVNWLVCSSDSYVRFISGLYVLIINRNCRTRIPMNRLVRCLKVGSLVAAGVSVMAGLTRSCQRRPVPSVWFTGTDRTSLGSICNLELDTSYKQGTLCILGRLIIIWCVYMWYKYSGLILLEGLLNYVYLRWMQMLQ